MTSDASDPTSTSGPPGPAAPLEPKAVLQRYLQQQRDAVLYKLDGLSEYDVRRPLTPTGTNLLGLVKHLAAVECGYFGDVFARPFPDEPAWMSDNDTPNVDMWATAQEGRADVVGLYRAVSAHADKTIAELELSAPGSVPWWGVRSAVTLQQVLVHVIAETARHAGQADIVRELVDGAAGLRPGVSNLPDVEPAWWAGYREQVQAAAATFHDAD